MEIEITDELRQQFGNVSDETIEEILRENPKYANGKKDITTGSDDDVEEISDDTETDDDRGDADETDDSEDDEVEDGDSDSDKDEDDDDDDEEDVEDDHVAGKTVSLNALHQARKKAKQLRTEKESLAQRVAMLEAELTNRPAQQTPNAPALPQIPTPTNTVDDSTETIITEAQRRFKQITGRNYDEDFPEPGDASKWKIIITDAAIDYRAVRQDNLRRQQEAEQQLRVRQDFNQSIASYWQNETKAPDFNERRADFIARLNAMDGESREDVLDALSRIDSGQATRADLRLFKDEWRKGVATKEKPPVPRVDDAKRKTSIAERAKQAAALPRTAGRKTGAGNTGNSVAENAQYIVDNWDMLTEDQREQFRKISGMKA